MLNYEFNPDLVQITARNLQYNFQGTLTFGQIDRACEVRVIGETDSWKLLADAETFIKTKIPKGTQDSAEPLCLARGYQSRGLPGADDTVIVTVSFLYNETPVDPTVWTVQSDTYYELDASDTQYDANGNPQAIAITNYIQDWASPDADLPMIQEAPGEPKVAEAPMPPEFGTVVVPFRRKRWTFTKQLYDRDAAYRFDSKSINYLGRLNSVTYTGMNANGINQNLSLDPGTVQCTNADVNYSPYQARYIVTVIVVWKEEGWQPWVKYNGPYGGFIDNTWKAGKTSSGKSYQANGMLQSTAIKTTDLNELLTLV